MRHPDIAEIVQRDRRYAYEAYEFIFQALEHTQLLFGRTTPGVPKTSEQHVSGAEILAGTVDLARKEFGLLAKTVFQQWGLRRTDDIGELVFNLIEANLLSKTDSDRRADFHEVFDLERELSEGYLITLQENTPTRRGAR